MSLQPVDLTGGESVYCVNQAQLDRAFQLAAADHESGPRIRSALEELDQKLSRNERAALAFVLIDQLLKSSPRG
jgi:hypothetical protein